jgi:hypothetical protein
MDELSQMDVELEALAKAQRQSPRASPPLPATFEVDAVVDDEATRKAGRTVYRDQEIIQIKVSPNQTRRRVVTDDDRRNYAAQYLAWKKNNNAPDALEGFPLAQWAMIPGKAVVRQFSDYGIRTVEQLAVATDAVVQSVGPFLNLRQHARDWVATAQSQAPVAALRDRVADLEAQNAALRQMVETQSRDIASARQNGGALPAAAAPDPRLAEMQAQIAALIAAVQPRSAQPPVDNEHVAPGCEQFTPETIAANKPKRRGRPPGTKNKKPPEALPEA